MGFNIRWYGGTPPRDKTRRQKGSTLTKPSKDKTLSKCKELGETIKLFVGETQEKLITKLNPILRGFANYYSHGVSKDVFRYISYRLWKYLWQWAKRRHPDKPKRWIKKTYFHRIGSRNWVFGCYTKDRRGDSRFLELYNLPSTKIKRHIKVKGKASPDDASLREYWEKRHQKDAKKRWDKDSVLDNVANNQSYKCQVCKGYLISGEEIEIHHIVPVSEGGVDNIHNLQILHRACHKQVHSKTKLR